MTNKPYQSECQTWEQVLPLFKVGTVYKYTPKYEQHLKKNNEEEFIFRKETPHLYKPHFVGLFKLTSIKGEGKYQADFEFSSLDGTPVFPNHRFIQVASEVYDEKDLDLMVNLSDVGL